MQYIVALLAVRKLEGWEQKNTKRTKRQASLRSAKNLLIRKTKANSKAKITVLESKIEDLKKYKPKVRKQILARKVS